MSDWSEIYSRIAFNDDNTEDEAEETSSDKDYCSCELTETNFLTTQCNIIVYNFFYKY